MRRIPIITTIILLLPTFLFAQEKPIEKKADTEKKEESKKENDNDFGWSKRVSFIVGGGISIVSNKLYQDPIVDKANNHVQIEALQRWKPNLTLGISYTPYLANTVRRIKVVENNEVTFKTLIEYYPKGLTFSLFLNPVSVSKLSENSLSNTVDLGLGVGYRADNFSFLVTSEFFAIRQPRAYFIEQYLDKNQSYVVDGQVQKAFDINDNSIFTKKIAASFGIKFAYTFDVIRSFYASSQEKK